MRLSRSPEAGVVPLGSSSPLTLEESAELVGRYCFFERRLFEILGSWSTGLAEPAVQVHLDRISRHHAWHAELFGERLPVIGEVAAETWVRPDETTIQALSSSLASLEIDSSRHAALRCVGALYRVVVPRIVATYDRHFSATASVCDGPLQRAFDLVLRDEVRDWRAGEALLQDLITGPDDVAVVAQVAHRLESQIVAAHRGGGLLQGPFRTGRTG